MKILKFTLSGKTGFFKKPDVNTYLYFTYGNIHKVALLGIFGAVLGLGGYNSMKLKEQLKKHDKKDKSILPEFPEFYEKLKDIKVSVVPNNENGFIPKKLQIFNNSVGYASKEQGGNLIVKEQWLENPSWDIYVQVDSDESKKLAEYILDKKAVYSPYLGKNDHFADITNPQIIEAEKISESNSISRIDCLFIKGDFEVILPDEEDDEDVDYDNLFKYEEKLPIALSRDTNMYELETFVFTNMKAEYMKNSSIYKVQEKNIIFY